MTLNALYGSNFLFLSPMEQQQNYWLFQANPKVFRLRDALCAEVVQTFAVTSHSKHIEIGDKVILWQTGKFAGIYALAKVVSAVENLPIYAAEKAYFQAVPEHTKRVKLEIEYNLWDKPITKEILPDTTAFDSFYAGLPGTNFQANAEQYEAIIEQIEQLDVVHEPQTDYYIRPVPHPPLNLILYGPPGTGKTYQTVNHALSIIEQRSLDELGLEDRAELRERFNEHLQTGRIQFVTFHQSFTYEDFVEGIKPQTQDGQISYQIEDGIFKRIARAAENDWEEGKRHVLIIDEINRGNIAGIFGELITLIEADKRMAAREMLELTLPYSKQKFAIPPNLYFIGTMNTADRNVELLDIALRRRFTFQEVLPQAPILRQQAVEAGVELDKLLSRINERIRLLLGEDYCIGHAYFFDISTLDELRNLFTLRIIPLLQEYFLGDLGKVGLVLGKAFIEEISIGNHELLADFPHEITGDLLNKKSYQLRPKQDWTEADFIRIYDSEYQ